MSFMAQFPVPSCTAFSPSPFGFLQWMYELSACCFSVNHSVADQWCLFSIFKAFHPSSVTTGAHTSISVHMTKLPLDVSGSVVLLHSEFFQCMLMELYIADSHFVTWIVGTLLVFMNWTCIHTGEDSCCYWYYSLCFIIYITCVCWLCSWLLVWPS